MKYLYFYKYLYVIYSRCVTMPSTSLQYGTLRLIPLSSDESLYQFMAKPHVFRAENDPSTSNDKTIIKMIINAPTDPISISARPKYLFSTNNNLRRKLQLLDLLYFGNVSMPINDTYDSKDLVIKI